MTKTERSGPFTPYSQSRLYHDLAENQYLQPFDIGEDLIAEADSSLAIPDANCDVLSLKSAPERSNKKSKIEGTQQKMHELVKSWKPLGRIVDAACQDTPNLGSNKLDLILREADLVGELSIMSLVEIKKLPENAHQKEFAPEEMGQTLKFAMKVLEKQPWRPHVYAGLCDLRRFKFFKVTRVNGDYPYSFKHTPIYLDVNGWEVFRKLVSQSNETLGYQKCSVLGWTVGKVLGVGGTAVVCEARRVAGAAADADSSSSSSSSSSGSTSGSAVTSLDCVAKLYSGSNALEDRMREARALAALADIGHMSQIVPEAPDTTGSGRPVLLKHPRGCMAGDGVFPLVIDYLPLVDTVAGVHRRNYLHNDIAPANIFFTQSAGQKPPVVFLNDFGSATQYSASASASASILPSNLKSRPLFYPSSVLGFVIGPRHDLLALVLSIFVLTQKNSYDKTAVTTVTQLEAVAVRMQPWKDAVDAAKVCNYDGVKQALMKMAV